MPRDIFHLTSAGSVDDGKSTILARLLLDTGSVFEDQLDGIDPSAVTATNIADLLDGLESERDQGITIDVAHRFFDSATRRYHLTDSPGHEQYTRNMATAASHADAVLLVVDARAGVKPQTRTHLRIAHLLGIRQLIVAVNKMDLVGFRRHIFEDRSEEITDVLRVLEDVEATIIPVSGLGGDNIVRRSRSLKWWAGPTILEALDSLSVPTFATAAGVLCIQDVQRVAGGGRRYLASLVAGEVSTGDTLMITGRKVNVRLVDLIQGGVHTSSLRAPAEASFTSEADIDLGRGDVLSLGSTLSFSDQFQSNLVWLAEESGIPGRYYELRLGHSSTRATMTRVWGVDMSTGAREAELQSLPATALAVVNIDAVSKLAFTAHADLAELGRFVLVDSTTGQTVAAGVITHSLRRGENIVPHDFHLQTSDRELLTGRRGQVVWLTGLSGSGKSTIADQLSLRLAHEGVAHSVLDGDSLRSGLNRDLGFTETDRVENIRRAAEVAKLMADSGLTVIVSLISPYRADREVAREIVGSERFTEVWVNTPIEVCESRDPKGLYRKARAGLIPNFTGVNAPYEDATDADIEVDGRSPIVESVGKIAKVLWSNLS